MSKIQDVIEEAKWRQGREGFPMEYLLMALDIIGDILMGVALDDYQGSREFEEDAIEYCKEAGWRSPT